MNRIALETDAKTCGGGSGTVEANRLCTKSKAVSFGCDVSVEYADSQLVPVSALSPSGPTVVDISITPVGGSSYTYAYDDDLDTYDFYVKGVGSDGSEMNVIADCVINLLFGGDAFEVSSVSASNQTVTIRKKAKGWSESLPSHEVVMEVTYASSLHKQQRILTFSKASVTLHLKVSNWDFVNERGVFKGTLMPNDYDIVVAQLMPDTQLGSPVFANAYVSGGDSATWNALTADNSASVFTFTLTGSDSNKVKFDYQGNFGTINRVYWAAGNLLLVEPQDGKRSYSFTLSDM